MFGLRKKITSRLALGAGGAKRICSSGLLRILERARFPINIITGSCASALVEAIYCQSGNIDKTESRIRDLLATDFCKEFRSNRHLAGNNLFL